MEKMIRYKAAAFLAALAIMLLAACAWALGESARVMTPGGPLNVRKKPDTRADLTGTVPNRALVEAEETQGDWTRIRYQKITGYVKTEFLRLSSQLPGRTVYADEGTLLIREEPREDAPILWPADASEAVTVLDLSGDWAHVTCGERTGYVPAAALSFQLEMPSSQRNWLREQGILAMDADLLSAAENGTVLAALKAGETLTVTEIRDRNCLAVTASGCGWLPVDAVSLAGPADTADTLEGLLPLEAAESAKKAMDKAYKGFSKVRTWCAVAVYEGAVYRCGFFDGDDRYLYGALVDPAGKVTFTADYTAFAAPISPRNLLDAGQVDLHVGNLSPAVGEVTDITVSAWEGCSCRYTLLRQENILCETRDGSHFSASWRPREEGEYTLRVTVTDGEGRQASAEQVLTVAGRAPAKAGIYSQKDGWWLDKAYRDSTLDRSGCAIFTLSHALQRMGHTGPEADPETLARAYALCLRPEGTNNERLIREAAEDFGFSTQSALIHDEKRIAQLLREGAMFSFSIARGHIALVCGISDDGGMGAVTDSAPLATFQRIAGDSLYLRMNSGSFREALKMEDLPGARWYFETDDYGGLEYWLRLTYIAQRGVRLIMPR